MTPTDQEIAQLTGVAFPTGVPIQEISSFPSPEDQRAGKFSLKWIGKIREEYNIFEQTTIGGSVVWGYCFLQMLGFPLPTAYDIAIITADKFIEVAPMVYNYFLDDAQSAPTSYLVSLPPNIPLPPSGAQIPLDELPIGSGIYPLPPDLRLGT